MKKYFFGSFLSADGERYRAMLNEFLFTKIKGEDIGNIWQEEALAVNGDRYRAKLNKFLFTKIEKEEATFGFNKTALYATQPKHTRCFAPCF